MWTAHPRIKSSYGFPDKYRDADFFRSDRFLGAAWKAMPADLSQPRLGVRSPRPVRRHGQLGAAQVRARARWTSSRSMPDYELYGHMNINYLKLDRCRASTTAGSRCSTPCARAASSSAPGEVLLPEFKVGGKESGQTLTLAGGTTVEVTARRRVDVPAGFRRGHLGRRRRGPSAARRPQRGRAFSAQGAATSRGPDGREWVRLEVWDIAANGAFSQPVWIE